MYVSDCEFGLEEEATIWIASQIGGLIRFVPTPTESGAENGVFKPEEYRNARCKQARLLECKFMVCNWKCRCDLE